MLLNLDDLGPTLQPATRQVGTHDIAVQRSMPDIRDIPSKQRIGLPPVGAVIVKHFALRELAGTDAAAPSPTRIIGDTIRRIGDHQIRPGSRQHRLHVRRVGAVATANPVVAQQPYVAGQRDYLVDDVPGIAVPSVGSRCGEQRSLAALRNGNARGYVMAAVESPAFGTTLNRYAPTEFFSV